MTATDFCGCCGKPPEACTCWEFPGWGKVENIDDLSVDLAAHQPTPRRLGVWRATAICGNDITSSCLYVSALAAIYAGPLAPLALLLVAGVLFLFRGVYAEVGSALPLNGGAYNVLLNTTTKARAALAACLTLLSYIATAVISGGEAMSYAAEMFTGLNTLWATVILLGVFALLNILGISDSANVALGIFVFHMFTLTVLVLIGGASLIADPSVFTENILSPVASWPSPRSGGVWLALFFGFSSAMLGISGFESSANYIEEQQPGVFPKTLRNMWIAVAVFNPAISLLSFALLPVGEIASHKEALLLEMGKRGAANVTGLPTEAFFPQLVAAWISFDAVIVLSGAVLTSYVGVTGLIRRMSMDLCLPQFLLQTNRWRGTNHWIVLTFLVLCCSILLITSGKIELLAGVYTLSFLSVMALFAVGNLLLKRRRPRLKRESRASVATVSVALAAVLAALVGNIMMDPGHVRVFMLYLVIAIAVVAIIFFRSRILTLALQLCASLYRLPVLRHFRMAETIAALLHEVQCRSVVFVASKGTLEELRAAAEYVRRNEQFRFLKVVWCYEEGSEIPDDLGTVHANADREFPSLHIDMLVVRGRLEPAFVVALGRRLRVPLNYIFIDAATAASADDVAEWGGARIIA